MAKYRKKPVVIQAWQWTGRTLADAWKFCESNGLPRFNIGSLKGKTGLIIPTLEGNHVASQYDWIIEGVAGEFYPCKPDIFEQTYELVDVK